MNYTIDDLLVLMSRLRDPDDGCPWDLAQSYQSIVDSTIEEVYEVVEAIEQQDYVQLKDELGDLLFQIVFYSQLGKEEGRFEFADIAHNITEKLLRRHPHVFPDGTLESRRDEEMASEDSSIKANWEAIKHKERANKGHTSVLDDVPIAFPAITRARKLQKRASNQGFDWKSSSGVYDKLMEEIQELQEAESSADKQQIEDELGDVLFTVINLSRHLKVDAETALRKANRKFEQRFRLVEQQYQEEQKSMMDATEDELESAWQQAKLERIPS